MATLEDIAADGGNGDYPPFIDADGKTELTSSQHPFWVIGGTPKRTSAYGDQTWYVIRFGAPGKTTKVQGGAEITITAPGWGANAESWTLSFDANDDRVEQMTKIKSALALDDTGYIGPCFLHAIPTKKGNTYLKIRGSRDENPVAPSDPPVNGSTTPPKDQAPNDDQDIPF